MVFPLVVQMFTLLYRLQYVHELLSRVTKHERARQNLNVALWPLMISSRGDKAMF